MLASTLTVMSLLPFAPGEVGQGLGAWMAWVAVPGSGRDVVEGELALEETLAEAAVDSGDEDDGGRHLG